MEDSKEWAKKQAGPEESVGIVSADTAHGCLNPGAGLSRVGKTVQPAPSGTAPWELKDKKGLIGA